MAVTERFADLVRLPVSDLDPYPSRNGRVGRFTTETNQVLRRVPV